MIYTISCRCHCINFIFIIRYALIWSENILTDTKEGSIMSIVLFLIVFILLSLIVSRYLYSVALNVPSKIDVVFNPIEKLIYRLIGTKLEHMSALRRISNIFCCLTD